MASVNIVQTDNGIRIRDLEATRWHWLRLPLRWRWFIC